MPIVFFFGFADLRAIMKPTKPKQSMEAFRLSSYLSGRNAAYIEALYEDYLNDPQGVSNEWSQYFETLSNGQMGPVDVSHQAIRQQFRDLATKPKFAAFAPQAPLLEKQRAVDHFIEAYRRFGHLNAKVDPLGITSPADQRLQLSHYQLLDSDLNQTFQTRGLLPNAQATLSEIHTALQHCYTSTIGVEYSRISDETEREWLRDYVERRLPSAKHDVKTKRNILKQLTAAEGLEKYLGINYPGQKRFSIEGGDSLIPLLDQLAKRARMVDIREVVIGMAHRGRLNVLLNVIGQSPKELFQEFDGTKDYGMTSGDVKYHRGFSSDVKTEAGPIHLSLSFNPSHLEFISPVVMGSIRARQERSDSQKRYDYAMAVLIHGDAAFAGQGIVMESLNMSQTRAYHIGGSIHIILNNQIGFTTSDPRDARSSHYCSDLAKMIDAPVFHVNGDDPEAVIDVAQLALDYRCQFNKDIFIDLVCYRRHGHQEVDEPRATQPMMYQHIMKKETPRALYAKQLLQEGVCAQDEVDQWIEDYRKRLDEGLSTIETNHRGLSEHYASNWTRFIDSHWSTLVNTAASKKKIVSLAKKLEALPEGFKLQRNVAMIMEARKKMTQGERPLDWGYAETMAYAMLLDEGYPVRLAGEDSRRGTFFHRHAVLFDENSGESYTPLLHLAKDQAHLQVYDSLLSEAGSMGFEYGYAKTDPNALVIWEAQFGDFANGAQVIIDQFISSGWQKWNRLNGLVLFLPHGHEGMGPEHSSARLERYMQLCAQDNMQVVVPSTPSQIFHLLRRQVLRPYRKPLIVMTPKSLLRHPLAVSSLDDLAKGCFQLVIPEVDKLNGNKVRRVVLCAGKVYYELLTKRREQKIDDIAIIRIEQLYPFPYEELSVALKSYPNANEIVWCQEEPKNQGAWFITRDRLMKSLPEGKQISYAGRQPMAAPAGGYPSLHIKQQTELVMLALDIEVPESMVVK